MDGETKCECTFITASHLGQLQYQKLAYTNPIYNLKPLLTTAHQSCLTTRQDMGEDKPGKITENIAWLIKQKKNIYGGGSEGLVYRYIYNGFHNEASLVLSLLVKLKYPLCHKNQYQYHI